MERKDIVAMLHIWDWREKAGGPTKFASNGRRLPKEKLYKFGAKTAWERSDSVPSKLDPLLGHEYHGDNSDHLGTSWW